MASELKPFRVGRSLGTTIYRGDEPQPCAWVAGDPDLASRIVEALNQRPSDAVLEAARKVADWWRTQWNEKSASVFGLKHHIGDTDEFKMFNALAAMLPGESIEYGKDGNGDQIRKATKESSGEPKGEK